VRTVTKENGRERSDSKGSATVVAASASEWWVATSVSEWKVANQSHSLTLAATDETGAAASVFRVRPRRPPVQLLHHQMTPFAILLVLVAAVLHATWNLAAKRAGSGVPFIFVTGLIINALYVPVLLTYFVWTRPTLSWSMLGPVAVSALLKTGYAIFLQRAYRTGDFSLVYPLARGTGPLLATVGAIVFLGERPSWLGAAGSLLIIGSIFLLTGGERLWQRQPKPKTAPATSVGAGVRNGLITGAFIAAYTVWDRYGVAGRGIPPVLFDAGTALMMTLLVAPFAWPRLAEVRNEWRTHRREAFTMAVLSPIGYVLVLTAMTFTPVSYVAPAREFSILIGAFLGARMFKERDTPRRLWAAAGMVVGLIALALA
jgi:drug/metabolite transporter (DMT)-like permease